jgi:hypothetical protein
MVFMDYRSRIGVRDDKQFYYSIAHLVILGLSEKDLVILSQPTLKLRQAWLVSGSRIFITEHRSQIGDTGMTKKYQ